MWQKTHTQRDIMNFEDNMDRLISGVWTRARIAAAFGLLAASAAHGQAMRGMADAPPTEQPSSQSAPAVDAQNRPMWPGQGGVAAPQPAQPAPEQPSASPARTYTPVTTGAPWRRLDHGLLLDNPPQVMLFCSPKSVWCSTVKPQLAQLGVQLGGQADFVLAPAVAGVDDLPFAKAQIAAQKVIGYSAAFDLMLSRAFASGLDSSSDSQVEDLIKKNYPQVGPQIAQIYEEPATDVLAREYALRLKAFGVRSLPSVVVKGRCVIRPEDLTGPQEYVARVRLALANCR